ncbi:uncharacterized protein LOC119080358 [Bradysia coprophila]|uniref:uncharacterized protein LOC119080358 n=1 Tax=Bradysia coprophila TaxID=38358 RepID=UPI00187DB46A|nr:uncharacterized protein LOC119080358 [Bradysia coprophila]
MNSVNFLVLFLGLVATHAGSIRAATTSLIDATTNVVAQQDIRSQFDQILVQMCASEIDRNRTSSAMVKLDQMSNAKEQFGDVVKFFTQHYVDNFDNLLRFIDQIVTTELRQEACNVLSNTIDSNGLDLVNVLRFENFIYTRLESTATDEGKDFYVKIHTNVSHYISQRLNDFVASIKGTSNVDVVPNLARVVDLNSFDAMNKVLEITEAIPYQNQMQFVGKILSRMRNESNYKHVYHILTRIMSLKYSRSDFNNCILLQIENELPSKLKPLFTSDGDWSIENVATKEFMYPPDSRNRTRNVLLSPQSRSLWVPFRNAYIHDSEIFFFCYGVYNCLSVVSNNNVSIPIIEAVDMRDPDRTLSHWYLLMSNDLDTFQIKRTDTDQCLNASEEQVLENGELRRQVLFTECGLDSLSSRWQFRAGDPKQFPMRRLSNSSKQCTT